MWNSFLDWAAYGIVRLSAYVFQSLPLRFALGVGRSLGGVVYGFDKRRRVAYANLKRAFPQSSARERKRWTKESFQHLGMTAVEILRFPKLKKEDTERLVIAHGYENYLRQYSSGKGLILLTAHMGNWEFSQIVEGLRGRPMTVLARRQKYPKLDQLLNSFRQHYGSVSVGKENEGLRDLIRTLRRGGCVGMLGDQQGGADGVWVRFFGCLTTAPRGPMALALKMGIPVMPVFFVRRHTSCHELFMEPPLELIRTGNSEKDIQVNLEQYLRRLESYIARYPSQWLWGHKRWKRSRTKRIVLLSDGKPGHVKQSEAVVKEMAESVERKGKPSFEMPVERIEIRFRSLWRKRFFFFFAFFFIPLAQGRLHWLRFFLTPETSEALERVQADLVVSAGSSLVPLNLCLGRENLAKSVVLMKPSFPFNLFRYDLALIPAHDQGLMPRGHFRIQGALSGVDTEVLESSRETLASSIRDPKKVRVGLFLGGDTHHFKLSLSDVERILMEVERASARLGGDYLVTTSRRTPETISQFLRRRLEGDRRCQLSVIASEDKRPEVVPGMMALADFLVVTEDSVSMISEALSSGKSVVVVKMNRDGLPEKHYRFQEILEREWGIPVVEVNRLGEVLSRKSSKDPRDHVERERIRIREKLESLL